MDEELRLEISKIVSLAHAPPILPRLIPTDNSRPSGSKDNTSQEEASGSGVKDSGRPSPKQSKPLIVPTLSKKSRKYLGMKSFELLYRIDDDKIVSFCQEHNLIAKNVICSCGNLMQLEEKESRSDSVWTCFSKSHTARPHQTILKGTFFENVDIPIYNTLWIAYMWVHEYSPTSMTHECETSHKNLIDCCEYCLDLCRQIIEHKRDPIGGEGRSIDIFECKVAKGKEPNERWTFCGIEQNSTNSLQLVLDNKKSYTVFEIFDMYFLPGTKVVSHNWNTFKNLNQRDFLYLMNDKSISFFDLATKKNMDNFQEFKMATKRPPKGLNKWSKLEYGPSFFEKMYRKTLAFAPDAYLTFLHDIAKVYKPVETFGL